MSQELEVRFYDVRDAIIIKLKERGGDPNVRAKQGGYEWIRVASSEFDDGSLGLLLSVDGQWSGKCDMMGYDIGESPNIDRLLIEFGQIEQDKIRVREWKHKKESPLGKFITYVSGKKQEDKSPYSDLVHLNEDEEWEEHLSHPEKRKKLLLGLVESMEQTLTELSKT